jgi:DNA-binding NarL/FixJ family response regulator
MVRLAIYDDNVARRESLGALFDMMPEVCVVGSFENCAHVLEDMDKTNPDLVLMDLEMPVQDGIQGIQLIKKKFPAIKIIVQTAYDDDDRVFAALKSGAEGYILKSATVNKIMQSIDDVMNGGVSMSPSIALKVMDYFGNELRKAKPPEIAENKAYNLTPKELDILKRLSKGFSYKLIADELAISYFTVNNHIKRIYEKLQVHSLGEAIGIAHREGLV